MARRRRGGHRMTPKRRAALKKAQTASARKRKGMGRGKKVAIGLGIATVAAVSAHKLSGSSLSVKRSSNVSFMTGAQLPNGMRNMHMGNRTAGMTFGYGKRKATISYRLGREKKTVLGSSATRNAPIDKDAIPVYKQKAQKNWPHIGADKAREQNSRLRGAGMIG